MTERNVTIEIDTLVLEGVPAHQAGRVEDAIRGELARLIADRGLPDGLAARGDESLDAGTVAIRPDARPEALGRDLAAALYREFRR